MAGLLDVIFYLIASEGAINVLPLYKIVEVANPLSIITTEAPTVRTVHFPARINFVSELVSEIALKYSLATQAGMPRFISVAETIPVAAKRPTHKQKRKVFFIRRLWLQLAKIT